MSEQAPMQIVPGISISGTGEATVDPALTEVLCELAISLEEPTGLPVDVEHVVAALLLASRAGEIDSDVLLGTHSPQLMQCLTRHVRTVFAAFGGQLGTES